MSNGKLLTLFLDYENELRATMPDFAHQLSALLNVPPKVVDYSKKAVAAYEDFNIDEEELEEKSDEEVDELLGDSNKAKRKLGWTPKTSLEDLIEEMIEKDKEEANKKLLLKQKGFEVSDTLESPPSIF